MGCGLFVVLIPVQFSFTRLFTRFRQRAAEIGDRRVNLMRQVIEGIRVIKMYVWEDSFKSLIARLRLEGSIASKYSYHRRAYTVIMTRNLFRRTIAAMNLFFFLCRPFGKLQNSQKLHALHEQKLLQDATHRMLLSSRPRYTWVEKNICSKLATTFCQVLQNYP